MAYKRVTSREVKVGDIIRLEWSPLTLTIIMVDKCHRNNKEKGFCYNYNTCNERRRLNGVVTQIDGRYYDSNSNKLFDMVQYKCCRTLTLKQKND